MNGLIGSTVPRITVNAPDGSEYQLKSLITGFERRQMETAGMLIQSTYGEMKSPTDDDIVYYKMNLADRELKMLETYLVGWSHADDRGKQLTITRERIKQLPPDHWKILSKKIGELQKEQYGPSGESELGESSTTSSDSSSSTKQT